MMLLYSSPISPYASRCRIQIHHKSLPVQIVPPPGGMGSEQVKAKNPIGKVPVLDLGDRALSESWTIMEYLETLFPVPPMRPTDAYEWAKLQELVRFTDLYLAPAMFPLFLALRGKVDAAGVATALTGLKAQLGTLDPLLARRSSMAFDLADAALLPVAWYAQVLARHFGEPDCLAGLLHTQAWWTSASAVGAAAKVLAEMEHGLRAALPAVFAAH